MHARRVRERLHARDGLGGVARGQLPRAHDPRARLHEPARLVDVPCGPPATDTRLSAHTRGSQRIKRRALWGMGLPGWGPRAPSPLNLRWISGRSAGNCSAAYSVGAVARPERRSFRAGFPSVLALPVKSCAHPGVEERQRATPAAHASSLRGRPRGGLGVGTGPRLRAPRRRL